MSEPVVVAGAGIGGLTLALSLVQRGIPVTVLERAKKLEEAGAGIQLSPNAGRVLEALGLSAELDQVSVRPAAIRIGDGLTGRSIAEIPLGPEATVRYGAPYRVLHRADLQRVLLNALAAADDKVLQLGEQVGGIVDELPGLVVSSKGPEGAIRNRPARLLVGADGVRSTVRRLLEPGSEPVYSGLTAWRSLVPAHAAPGVFGQSATHVFLAPDAHLVAYPVAGGAHINVVLVAKAAPGEPAGKAAHPSACATESWGGAPRQLVEAAKGWGAWPLFNSTPAMFGGRAITLLGDAAHPVLPFLAQGAALAVEDAAVLAFELTTRGPVEAARAYEAERKKRWRLVGQAAASNGRIFHLGGAAALLRNAALRLTPKTRLLAQYDWVFGWRPPE